MAEATAPLCGVGVIGDSERFRLSPELVHLVSNVVSDELWQWHEQRRAVAPDGVHGRAKGVNADLANDVPVV